MRRKSRIGGAFSKVAEGSADIGVGIAEKIGGRGLKNGIGKIATGIASYCGEGDDKEATPVERLARHHLRLNAVVHLLGRFIGMEEAEDFRPAWVQCVSHELLELARGASELYSKTVEGEEAWNSWPGPRVSAAVYELEDEEAAYCRMIREGKLGAEAQMEAAKKTFETAIVFEQLIARFLEAYLGSAVAAKG